MIDPDTSDYENEYDQKHRLSLNLETVRNVDEKQEPNLVENDQ